MLHSAHRLLRLPRTSGDEDTLDGNFWLIQGSMNKRMHILGFHKRQLYESAMSAGMKDERFRWPGYPGRAVIPFVLDRSVYGIRNVIYEGMQHYHRYTCIRFKERTNERDFIRIFYGDGCWSIIGRNGGQQNLSLGNGCAWVGLVIHELGHAIGLFHEHQRSDRDNYITVYRNNVIPDQMHNFVLTDPNREVIFAPYEYASIMHYGNYAFSRQPNRLPTMVAKTGVRLYEPYEKPGFTQTDLYRIKQLYKC
ncbi:astacin-like metalloprotease toxin 2 [Trichonephila inaurata madagascariensis]|uniref:Metalloendopeptidase n=1 Tax=Trichonephila inaurata madagascariensis TaxID=2747483 RepID=A0A8X6YDW8_9ARAC|nr:astacin-like metalloprotease toxin 2 [Trichonephila inaurata madagascariensis]